MKFVFFNDFNPGLLKDDRVIDISDFVKTSSPQATLEEFISNFRDFAPKLESALHDRKGFPLQHVRLRPPVPRPSLMLNGFSNFKEGAGLVRPLNLFLKSSRSIIGPKDTVNLPPVPAKVFHHEAELAFVISKSAKRIKREDAMESVFGYTATIDVSARRIPDVIGLWKHKSFDTFCPMGPALVTKDEIPDPHNLDIKLWVNGQLRQNYNTSDMAHQIPEIVEFASEVNTLGPGDLISCGTNHQGLGAIQDGDVVEIEIEHVGRMSVNVVDPLKRTWSRDIDDEMAKRLRQRDSRERR